MTNSNHAKGVKSTGIILSDIDGTIVRGSLVLEHALHVHERGIVDLGEHPENWVKDKKDEGAITALAEAYRNAIVGKTPLEIGAVDFVKSYASDPANFYSTIDVLREGKKNGYQVNLISGSPSYLVTPFARLFGFRSKGSNYKLDEEGRFNGVCVGMFNADAKRRYVSSLKVNQYKQVIAYGDTSSDIPLMEVAHKSYLVAPTPQTLSAANHLTHSVIHN